MILDNDVDEMHYTVSVTPGMTQTIACGIVDGTANKDYCKIFNPGGELVSSNACTYQVVVTMSDLGTWRCLGAVSYSMDPLEFKTELVMLGKCFQQISNNVSTFTMI